MNEMTDLTRVLLSVCLLPLFKNSSLGLMMILVSDLHCALNYCL